MTRLNYSKINQQRQMWRYGTEQFYLPPIPGSKAQEKKRWRKHSKKKKSTTASEVQITAKQLSASPSPPLTRAQKKRIARKKAKTNAKKLKAQQRKLERQRLRDDSQQQVVSGNRLSAKQFAKLRQRDHARIVAMAHAKHKQRAETPVLAPSSVKPDSEQ